MYDIKEKRHLPEYNQGVEERSKAGICPGEQVKQDQVDAHSEQSEGYAGGVFDDIEEIDPGIPRARQNVSKAIQVANDQESCCETKPDNHPPAVSLLLIADQPMTK